MAENVGWSRESYLSSLFQINLWPFLLHFITWKSLATIIMGHIAAHVFEVLLCVASCSECLRASKVPNLPPSCLVVNQAIELSTSGMFGMLRVHHTVFSVNHIRVRHWFTECFTGESCQSYSGPDLQGHSPFKSWLITRRL